MKKTAVLTALLAMVLLLVTLAFLTQDVSGSDIIPEPVWAPMEAMNGVVGVTAYNAPIYGEDFIVFEVAVSSQDVYPECTLLVDFKDPSYADEVSPLMPTTSVRYRRYGILNPNDPAPHPADAADLRLECEGVVAEIFSEGNTLPYQAEVRKVVVIPPTEEPTATNTVEPTATETSVPTATATSVPPTVEPTLVPTSVPPTLEPTPIPSPTKPGKGWGRK